MGLVGSVVAAEADIWLVQSGKGGIYEETTQAFLALMEREFRGNVGWRIGVWSELSSNSSPAPQLIIALGTGAWLEISNMGHDALPLTRIPVLAALVPQSTLFFVPRALGRSSAIFLDQPLDRITHLIRLALPDAQRVGVLFGPDSVSMRAALSKACSGRGLTLIEQTVTDAEKGLYPALREILSEADVLLAVPDRVVYHPSQVQNVFLSSYRQKIPVVSYSAAHVRAGALMALYTQPADVAWQLAQVVRSWLAGRVLPAPALAEAYSVAVNEQVARSLGLTLPSTKSLERSLATKGNN